MAVRSFKKGRARGRALPAVASAGASAVVLTVCLLAGCSQESPSPGSSSPSSAPAAGSASGGNHAPVVKSARITANALTRNDTVTVEFATDDADGDRVSVRYQWLVNDRPASGETSATLALGGLQRGDRVGMELTPVDARGAIGPAFRTEAVEVANTPPVVTRVMIEPSAVAKPGDVLRAAIDGSDQDGDPVKYLVEWWRNGKSLGKPARDEEQRTLATEGFTRGDLIVVGVTPYDAAGPGRFLVSEPLVLINRAPVITSSPGGLAKPGLFEYAVTATDPDNDSLTYKLETAPAGMTIEAGTGKITWEIPAGVTSPQQVRISVDDGHEGQAFQGFTLSPPPR